MNFKAVIKQLTPPIITEAVRQARLRGVKPEWEYMPDGWETNTADPALKGWSDQSVADSYLKRWKAFEAYTHGTQPFGISIEADSEEIPISAAINFHNIVMSFAYALDSAAVGKTTLRMLDWGGGLGHYALLARALRPDLALEYHCKELPLFVEQGQRLLPDAHFHSDDSWKAFEYDFVLASSAMHYIQNWQNALHEIAAAVTGYFFLTRTPIVKHAPSFVMVQRPYHYGYNTEYLGWCLNRQEVLACAGQASLTLVREFVIENPPYIHNAPEQCSYWGFLFRKDSAG